MHVVTLFGGPTVSGFQREPKNHRLRESAALRFDMDWQSEVAVQGHVIFTEIAVYR